MTAWLSALFLVGGAVICLIAAIGVLRLPDFFLRMHAATEAGVAGCGLVLIGVGFAYPSVEMWIKIVIAITFLLLTTPIAGHLLARAGYVAGVPLWSGTTDNQLEGELVRGQFERQPVMMMASRGGDERGADRSGRSINRIVLALTSGPDAEAVIGQAVALAKTHDADLVGLAIIDTKMLNNVGPVPIGGNFYAMQLRRSQVEKARRSLADIVQLFERTASNAGIRFSLVMEEGDPVELLVARQARHNLVLIGRAGWFDHGAGDGRSDPLAYLVWRGVYPLISIAKLPSEVRSITFVHDGSLHSDDTLRWFLDTDPWPDAELNLVPDGATAAGDIANALDLAAGRMRAARKGADGYTLQPMNSQVIIFGNEGHEGWINRARAASRPRYDDAPIVIFG